MPAQLSLPPSPQALRPLPLRPPEMTPEGGPRRCPAPNAVHRAAGLLMGILCGLTCSLTGCASSFHWVKDGFTAQHADAKFAACQLESERLRYFSSESDEEREARTRREAGLCMKADGWRWVESEGEAASDSADPVGEKSSIASAARPRQKDGARNPGSDGEQAPDGAAGEPADASSDAAADRAGDKPGEKSGGTAEDKSGEDDESDDDEDEDEE